MIVKLDHVVVESIYVKTFWLKPLKPYSFVAGQFAEISINDENGKLISRKFSLSSNPSSQLIAFTTKFTRPYSDFKAPLLSLKPGAEVFVSEPIGDFILPKNKARPLIFIAGSIGITPFLSIITELKATHQVRDITLFYCARNEADLLFTDQLAHSSITILPIIAASSSLMAKNVDKEISSLNSNSPLYYIAGSGNFITATQKQLQSSGVEQRHIITDVFLGY